MSSTVTTRVPLIVWLAACACVSQAIPALSRVESQRRPEAPAVETDASASDAGVDGASDAPAVGRQGGFVGVAVPPPPEVVSTARADLDGDGVVDEVRLYSDGVLRVFDGDRERFDGYGRPAGSIAPFDALSRWAYDGDEPLRVVDIDRRDRQRELMLVEMRGDEDPDATFTFFVYREGRLWPMLRRVDSDRRTFSLPHGVRPRIAGDGVVRARFERCVRDADQEHRTPGVAERVSVAYSLVDGTLPRAELAEHIDTSRRASQCVMAACPVVRVGADEQLAGEILRDLRGEGAETWQSLRLPPTAIDASGALIVTLREEKREVTSLDGVYLEADGRRIEPASCGSDRGAWCARDHRYETLSPGRSLRLQFQVGRARSLRLWARGFYVPLPAPQDG